jgi:hypothetical protein
VRFSIVNTLRETTLADLLTPTMPAAATLPPLQIQPLTTGA